MPRSRHASSAVLAASIILLVGVGPGGAGAVSVTAPPLPRSVAALGVTGAAYTNNDLDASTATTLFDIDSTLDQVSIQSPANNGILVATGRLTVDTSASVGFDIYSTLNGSGTTVNVEGFAVLTSAADGVARFYTVNLLQGRVTLVGNFTASNQVVDIAIPLNQ